MVGMDDVEAYGISFPHISVRDSVTTETHNLDILIQTYRSIVLKIQNLESLYYGPKC